MSVDRTLLPLADCLRAELIRRADGWYSKMARLSGDDFNLMMGRAAKDLKTWFMLANGLTYRGWWHNGGGIALPNIIAIGLGNEDDLYHLMPETAEDWDNLWRAVETTYESLWYKIDQATAEGCLIARRIITIRFWLHYRLQHLRQVQTASEVQEAA